MIQIDLAAILAQCAPVPAEEKINEKNEGPRNRNRLRRKFGDFGSGDQFRLAAEFELDRSLLQQGRLL